MRGSWVAFPDLRFDETDFPHRTAEGDQVAWRWRMRGTMSGPLDPPGFAATGRSMEVEGVDLWTMRDGRIARSRAFYDVNDLARQLAIAPPPGSRAERAMVRMQRLQARMLQPPGMTEPASTPSSSAPASPDAPRRGCSRSAARAWPSSGVGCGWAFQSAEWLVEASADALVGGGDLDAALFAPGTLARMARG